MLRETSWQRQLTTENCTERSLGAAIVARDFADVWLYLLMSLIGAAVATILAALVRGGPSAKEARVAKDDNGPGRSC